MKIKYLGPNDPIVEFCCEDAKNAYNILEVVIPRPGRIVASLWDMENEDEIEYPVNFCPWCGTPINEEDTHG